MKLHKNQTSQEHCQYMQHEWPQISQNYPHDDNNVTYMEEFICIHCRQNLKQRNPKMPDQACANGLKLDDIPQDLQQLLTLERRLISFRLPFITIIVMRRYGGHYKVSGPPVNVPTTLDQVINMLPHMPNQLQLYPIKLKRKLEYKSHYMYDVIHKDHVIAALTWLKKHNNHYKDIEINENWHTMISDDGLSHILIHDYDSNEIGNNDNSSSIMQQNNNESKEDYPHTCDKEPETHDLCKFNKHESHKHRDNILYSNQIADDLDTHSSDSDPELEEDQAALD